MLEEHAAVLKLRVLHDGHAVQILVRSPTAESWGRSHHGGHTRMFRKTTRLITLLGLLRCIDARKV